MMGTFEYPKEVVYERARQARQLTEEHRRLKDAYAHLHIAVGLACGARITEKDCALWDAARHADTIAAGQEETP